MERLIQVARPAVRRGRQLDVQVGWAGVDVAADGAEWGAGWVPVTCLTGDLKRLARAMEVDRYPVRPGEPPREGARKCARLHALPTVPEGEVVSGEARVLPDVPERGPHWAFLPQKWRESYARPFTKCAWLSTVP